MLNKFYDGIIFDLDGTMWDTRKPICEAWNIILSRHEEIHRTPIVETDLNDCMGLPMYDIAAKLFPQEQEQEMHLWTSCVHLRMDILQKEVEFFIHSLQKLFIH